MSKEQKNEIKEEHEEEIRQLEDTYFYPDDHREAPILESELSSETAVFYESFGIDSFKRFNLHVLDEENIIFVSGITFTIYNIKQKTRRLYFGRNRGIGSVAVHPGKFYFAVAEKGALPCIHIYEYPSMKLYRILRKGTESSYSHIIFNGNGQSIASIGSFPDYNICVWNWRQETLVLKAKAFSQEVYRVSFSNYSDQILTTSGTGHIRFWKIAKTFTGLKLQGEIGKFGQVELSDVSGFFGFPDGKVLSGSESGQVLLWEGNFIKAVLQLGKDQNCHKGFIEVVELQGENIITAGADGYIKWWDFNSIDNCEGDEQLNFYINPISEAHIVLDDQPANIISLLQEKDKFLLYDANGRILLYDLESKAIENLLSFNSGKFMDMCVCQFANGAATIGFDGAVRIWDFINKKEFASRKFNSEGTAIEWYQYYNDSRDRVICAGFKNGIMRILHIEKDNSLKLLKAIKVHKDAITFVKYSGSGEYLAVASEKGDIFFMKINPKEPEDPFAFCLFETGLSICSLTWNRMSTHILIGCKNGYVKEIAVPDWEKSDISQTYLQKNPVEKNFKMKMMLSQKPKIDEDDLLMAEDDFVPEDVEWETAPISACIYFEESTGKFLCAAENEYVGLLYICDFANDRPLEGIEIDRFLVNHLEINSSKTFLLIGYINGVVELRPLIDLKRSLKIYSHDKDIGVIRKAHLSKDNDFLLSIGEDSIFQCYKCDTKSIISAAKSGSQINTNEVCFTVDPQGLDEAFFDKCLPAAEKTDLPQDILKADIYSLQEEKLLAEEDRKRNLAEDHKTKVRREIDEIKREFDNLKKKESELEPEARIHENEWIIDPELKKILEAEVSDILDEATKEVTYDKEEQRVLTEKIKSYMLDELENLHFTVIGIKKPVEVSTLKVRKLTKYMEIKLEEINGYVEMEKSRGDDDEYFSSGNLSPGKKQNAALDTSPEDTQLKDKIIEKIKENKKNNYKLSYLDMIKAEYLLKNNSNQNDKNEKKCPREKMKKEQEYRNAYRLRVEEREPKSIDPETSKEVKLAKLNKGDYKLKVEEDYEVKDDDRMTMLKQKSYIFELENFIHSTKDRFNKELESMKDRKKKIIEKISVSNARLVEINKILGIEETLIQPLQNPAVENPDKKFEVTEEEIQAAMLQKEREKSKSTGMFGGMGLPEMTATSASIEQKDNNNSNTNAKKEDAGKTSTSESMNKKLATQEALKERRNKKINSNKIYEQQIQKMTEIKLLSEKNILLKEMNNQITLFDDDLENLWKEKITLEYEMKMSQMKLISLYQEYLIFVEMESRDVEWLAKLNELKFQMKNLKLRNDDLNSQMLDKDNLEKKLGIEHSEKEKMYYDNIYEDDEVRARRCYEVYKNHFSKNKDNADEEANDNDDDRMHEEDGEDDMDAVDPEDRNLVMPILQQPEKNQIMKQLHKVDKELQSVKEEKKSLAIDSKKLKSEIEKVKEALNESKKMLKKFQLQKLSKVNELYISLFLKARQVQNLKKSENMSFKIPPDLSDSVLFTYDELTKLAERSKVLENEAIAISKETEEVTTRVTDFTNQKTRLNEALKQATDEVNENYQLKFGEKIELKILDGVEETQNLKDLKKQFTIEERASRRRIEDAKKSMMATKQELISQKKENTRMIEKITTKGRDQLTLIRNLETANKEIFKEDKEEKKNDFTQYRKNLKEIVQLLAKEINDLKEEIDLFKQKGSHIYALVNPNKAQ